MRKITPEAILSYPHLFRPNAGPNGGAEKYSASLVFPAGTDLSELKKAALAVAKEKFGDKTAAMIKAGKLRLPFRDDVEEKGYPEGSVFINVRSNNKPGIVTTVPDPKTKKPMVATEEQVYPGVIVKASITAFAYDSNGNKGVSFALNNLQIIRDGERLDGRLAAENEFEADENASASLEDLGADEGGAESDELEELLK